MAKYSGDHLHKNIFADPAFSEKKFKTAIRNGFLETDRALHLDPDCNSESSGCTAITATITDKNVLYVVKSFCQKIWILLIELSQVLGF